jgi:hypothetical protein
MANRKFSCSLTRCLVLGVSSWLAACGSSREAVREDGASSDTSPARELPPSSPLAGSSPNDAQPTSGSAEDGSNAGQSAEGNAGASTTNEGPGLEAPVVDGPVMGADGNSDGAPEGAEDQPADDAPVGGEGAEADDGEAEEGAAGEDEGDATVPPARSMGFIGCSMAEDIANGYQAVGGDRLWPPYGTGGLVVQRWTNTNSAAWQMFDQQVANFGPPSAVWVQICIFENPGATYAEVTQLIGNAREHAAPGATIYITGQPLYEPSWECTLAGNTGPELTDELARQAADDPAQNVIYSGAFGPLGESTTRDTCHANGLGQELLGDQAVGFFGG